MTLMMKMMMINDNNNKSWHCRRWWWWVIKIMQMLTLTITMMMDDLPAASYSSWDCWQTSCPHTRPQTGSRSALTITITMVKPVILLYTMSQLSGMAVYITFCYPFIFCWALFSAFLVSIQSCIGYSPPSPPLPTPPLPTLHLLWVNEPMLSWSMDWIYPHRI